MTLPRTLLLVSSLAFAGGAALAEEEVSQSTPASPSPTPADPKPAAAAPAPQFAIGPVQFSGIVDAYYSMNFNHPGSGLNAFHNFDQKANSFSLNMAKMTMEHAPDPVGFRVDFGFGRMFDTFHATDPAVGIGRYLQQAYVSFKPEKAKGLQIDFGQFLTSAGAEATDTNASWNYSRSLMFALANPYFHFGLRTTMPLNKYFTAGFQVVNGWNNLEDNNSGKTIGVTGSFTTPKFTWNNTYYAGPEKNNENKGWRQLLDSNILVSPNAKTGFYLNFDYGTDKNVGGGSQRWVGVAGAARYQFTPFFAMSPRLEWFNDANGWATGTVQKVKEFTLTAEGKINDYSLVRLEYRRDWSDQRYFERGATPSASKNQDTILLGIVAFFGPKK
jgi:hypothetical protein